MMAKAETQNPFYSYSKVSGDLAEAAAPDTAFAISQAKTLYENPDRDGELSKIFLADDLYRTKTFDNGAQYESFCFHGPLGSFPFDGVLERILKKKDDFDKALVLTTDYRGAKQQAKRLAHKSLSACSTENPDAHELLDRITTATSIEKKSDDYRPRGVDLNDRQILFYDISQARNNLGAQIEKQRKAKYGEAISLLKEAINDDDSPDLRKYRKRLNAAFASNSSLPTPIANSQIEVLFSESDIGEQIQSLLSEFNKSKKRIIEEQVQGFIKAQNLTGTSQLYLDSAEEFKTDLGYEFLQELTKRLTIVNGGGSLKIGAVANFNYSHGEGVKLDDVFGKPHFFKPPSEYQRQGKIPQTKIIRARSLTERQTTNSADIATVTTTSAFNNALRDRIQKRILGGDKRVFVRAHSNKALDALRDSFARHNDTSRGKLSYGWIKENRAGYVDRQGIEHELSSPEQLLANWGNNFKTLIHSGHFDNLQEPADTVVTATKVKTPDRLEELATPLGTLRSDEKENNHLIYYQFGRINVEDAGQDQNPKLLLEQINRRHNSRGNISRELKPRLAGSGEASGGTQLSDVTEEESAIEQEWEQLSDQAKHFWTHAFGSPRRLMGYIRVYIAEKDEEKKIIGNKALFDNEVGCIWKMINLNSQLSSRPVLNHDKREVFESLFKQASKITGRGIQDYIPVYPSILGIENQREAHDRVSYVYKPLYSRVNNSKDPIVQDMDSLSSEELNHEKKITHRSKLIAEFLFENNQREILITQDLNGERADFDKILSSSILKLTGVEEAESSKESQLVSDFKEFIAVKKARKSELDSDTRLGISRRKAAAIVEDYILDEESELLAETREAELEERSRHLLNSLADAQPIEPLLADGDVEEATDAFYRYVCEYNDKPTIRDVLKVNPDLLKIANFDEANLVIRTLEPTVEVANRGVVSAWHKQFTQLNLADSLLAWYVLENHPELLKTSRHDELRDMLGLLSGGRRFADQPQQTEFRAFINFIYEKNPEALSTVASRRNSQSLNLEQVHAELRRSNPGLMGIHSREELVPALTRMMYSEMNKFNGQVNAGTKFTELSDEEYQRTVVRFTSELDYDVVATRLGLSTERINELYFPEALEDRFKASYRGLLDKAKAEDIDVGEFEGFWRRVWKDRGFSDAIAKSIVVEDIFRREYNSDLEYGLNTKICDSDSPGFFIFSSGGLTYGQYINGEYNSTDIDRLSTEKLALSWTAFAREDGTGAELSTRSEIWGNFLNEGLEGNITNEVREIARSGLGKISRTPAAAREHFYAVAESFLRAMKISEDELLELFQDFINSDFFKERKLNKKYTLPAVVTKFLGALSGYESPETHALVADFINYLGTVREDERDVTNIIREIINRQKTYLRDLRLKSSRLKTIAETPVVGSALAADFFYEMSGGIEIPRYRALIGEVAEAISEQVDNMDDQIVLTQGVTRNWKTIAEGYFFSNLYDSNNDVETVLGDEQGAFVVTIKNPTHFQPTIEITQEEVT